MVTFVAQFTFKIQVGVNPILVNIVMILELKKSIKLKKMPTLIVFSYQKRDNLKTYPLLIFLKTKTIFTGQNPLSLLCLL